MKRYFWIFLSLTLISTAQSSLASAAEAYHSGDYKKAQKILKKVAHRGNLRAQLDLAQMYEEGDGILKSGHL